MTDTLTGRRQVVIARLALHRRGKTKRGRKWELWEVWAETGDRRPITGVRLFTFLDLTCGEVLELDFEPWKRPDEYLLVEPEGPALQRAVPELRALITEVETQVAELARRVAQLERAMSRLESPRRFPPSQRSRPDQGHDRAQSTLAQ